MTEPVPLGDPRESAARAPLALADDGAANVVPIPKPRRVESIGDQVLEHIRREILSGRLVGGSRIDQHAIADELGVSIIPVRESIRQLEAEGLVEKRPYRGAFVAVLSMTELVDIYVARAALEELAARIAVERMTPDVLRSLEALLADMESATESGDRSALFDLNGAFHFTLYTASQNKILCQLIEGLWERSTVYRRRFTFMPERAQQALAEHKQILRACQQGDADAAGKAVKLNVAQTTNAISESGYGVDPGSPGPMNNKVPKD